MSTSLTGPSGACAHPGPREVLLEPTATYLLEHRVRGRVGVVAVQEQGLVHPQDPAPLPEVLVEEEQVLRHALWGDQQLQPGLC